MGLVFFPKSPRHVPLAHARELAVAAPPGLEKVALTVDADDQALADLVGTVPLDVLQLHGRETPERVAEIRGRFGLPVMKAIGVADRSDLAVANQFTGAADQLLIDAKPPPNGPLPGGNGLSFDWTLLDGWEAPLPWMLAGGLTPENAAEAVHRTGAKQLDLSSGVEDAPGEKSAEKMRAFMAALTSH